MSALAWFLPAFLLSLLLTPLARRLGLRAGIASPRSHDPIPVTGGISILVAAATGAGLFALTGRGVSLPSGLAAGVLTAAVFGFLDDVHPLRPWRKLVGQLVASQELLLIGRRRKCFDPFAHFDDALVALAGSAARGRHSYRKSVSEIE